jgi:hypothetical protein
MWSTGGGQGVELGGGQEAGGSTRAGRRCLVKDESRPDLPFPHRPPPRRPVVLTLLGQLKHWALGWAPQPSSHCAPAGGGGVGRGGLAGGGGRGGWPGGVAARLHCDDGGGGGKGCGGWAMPLGRRVRRHNIKAS